MRWITTKIRLTIGLVGIMLLVYMAATVVQLVPSAENATYKARADYCEALAISAAFMIQNREHAMLDKLIEQTTGRNAELVSIGIRNKYERLIFGSELHQSSWINEEVAEVDRQQISLRNGSRDWGQMEFVFLPAVVQRAGFLGGLSPWSRLAAFMGSMTFILYMIYLGAMLSQLNPSKAVPHRVRSALDNLTEGLLVLDRSGKVVLANKVFAILTGADADKLVGQKAQTMLDWKDAFGDPVTEYPWVQSASTGEHLMDRIMLLEVDDDEPVESSPDDPEDTSAVGKNKLLTFKVNCAPVMAESSKGNGVLVSFENVTELENSKKAAEQQAAQRALAQMQEERHA